MCKGNRQSTIKAILFKGAKIICTESGYAMTIKFYVPCWRNRYPHRLYFRSPAKRSACKKYEKEKVCQKLLCISKGKPDFRIPVKEIF